MQSIDEFTCVTNNPSLPTGVVDGELVALDLERGECFGLDRVGAAIWAMATTPVRVGEIADRLIETYDVDRARCLAEILPFVEDMIGQGLLRRQPR